MPSQIMKRDGRLETWSTDRISQAIFKALSASGIKDPILAKRLGHKVEIKLADFDIPEQEHVQDIVERVLMESRQFDVESLLVLASQEVIDRLLDEESTHLAELEQFIGHPIKLQAELLYSQEHYDVVLV